MRPKGKLYRIIMRPTMPYGSKGWAVDRRIEQSMSVAEMGMLRWMIRMSRKVRIRKE
jgi:hypothetical protein